MNSNNKMVVIGCGLMGSEIAAIFLSSSWSVTIVEPNQEKWPTAAIQIGELIAQLTNRSFNQKDLPVNFVANLNEVVWNNTELVLEAAAEDLSVKRGIFEALDKMVPVHIVIGSNSSGFPISDIARSCETAHRMANTHFFLPASIVPLVEIAKGKTTSEDTMHQLQEKLEAAGRVVVKINKDLPGFLANRMQHALMREVFSILDKGLATPEDIDKAVRFGFGFRYVAAGPLLQKELAGLETHLAAAASIYPSLCNDTTPPKGLTELVRCGKLGTKSLQGYWSWTESSANKQRSRYMHTLSEAAKLLVDDAKV